MLTIPARYSLSVITTGIDLASQAEHTATCSIAWMNGISEVRSWRCGVSGDDILSAIMESDKVGIDVPLGWLIAFVRAVVRHQTQRSWRAAKLRDLRYRATDKFVYEITKRWPLSVSTDRIGVPALRAAALLRGHELEHDLERVGSGNVVEVYPAASLRIWGFAADGYKGTKHAIARGTFVENLHSKARAWLVADQVFFDDIAVDDNILDAFIAALTSRAAAKNFVHLPPPHLRRAARIEGWIALPFSDSFEQLSE